MSLGQSDTNELVGAYAHDWWVKGDDHIAGLLAVARLVLADPDTWRVRLGMAPEVTGQAITTYGPPHSLEVGPDALCADARRYAVTTYGPPRYLEQRLRERA